MSATYDARQKAPFDVRLGPSPIIGNTVGHQGERRVRQRNKALKTLVADAVEVEPVSTAKFPANREKNREFGRIAVSVAPETVKSGAVTGLPKRIPYSTEQGIILAEQGILAREQGILSARIEIIAE